MSKSFFVFLALIVNSVIIAQGNLSEDVLNKLTAITPATPEAASLAKFGNISINECYGSPTYKIPLYKIKVGNYELPIYLSYGYTGFRIQEDAGLVGLGWALHAGGFVSREKKGYSPDEIGDYYSTIGPALANNTINQLIIRASFGLGVTPGNGSDAEPDIFNINAEGLYGQYVHNENRTPVIITNFTNYNINDFISANSNDYKIHITDAYGNRFMFDELVYMFDNQNNTPMPPMSGITNEVNYPTEWWIKEIKPNNTNKKITFEYYDNINGNDIYMKRKSYSKVKNYRYYIQRDGHQPPPSTTDIDEIVRDFYIQRKLIKQIFFPNGKIVFTVLDDTNTPQHLYYLSKIEIFRNDENSSVEPEPYITYNFEYNDINSYYKLLTRIRKINKDGVEEPFYHFEYYNTTPNHQIIATLRNVDKYGFYNGNNAYEEPNFELEKKGALKRIYYPTGGYTEINYEQNDIYERTLNCQESYVGNNNSDFIYNMTINPSDIIEGIKITKIIYGQYTNINAFPYNQEYYDMNNNTAYWEYDDLDDLIGEMGRDNPQSPPLNVVIDNKIEIKKDSVLDFLPEIIIRDTIDLPEEKIIKFNLKLNASLDQRVFSSAKISFSGPVECLCGNCINEIILNETLTEFNSSDGDCENICNQDHLRQSCSTNIYRIPAHTKIYYETKVKYFKIGNIYQAYACSTINSYEVSQVDNPIINVPVGGIRVAKTMDCVDNTGNNCINYKYNYVDDNGISTGHYIEMENNTKVSVTETRTVIPRSPEYNSAFNVLFVTSLPVPSAFFNGNTIYYDRVEKIVENNNNGKTVNYYQNDLLYDTNFNYYNNDYGQKMEVLPKEKEKIGKLIKTEIFNGDNKKLQTKTINYNFITFSNNRDISHRSYGAHFQGTIYTSFDALGVSLDDFPSYTNVYEHKSFMYKKTKQIDATVFNNKSIIKEEKLTYDDNTGNLVSTLMEKSNGFDIETRYFYPSDVIDINSLGNTPLTVDEFNTYNLMKAPTALHPDNVNMTSVPIQIEKTYIKLHKLINKERITYRFFNFSDQNENLPLLLPEKVWVAKGENDLEVKRIISDYDQYGNPIEVSKPDGPSTYYIWGYNKTKLIAQIQNFTQAQANQFQSLIQAVVDASDNDNDNMLTVPGGHERNLWQALNNLRNALPADIQMTSYTYDPLIGVTSITGPDGITVYYKYDAFNRLIQIIDKDNNILKEYDYHYKTN